jgi:hypothetical protein
MANLKKPDKKNSLDITPDCNNEKPIKILLSTYLNLFYKHEFMMIPSVVIKNTHHVHS